MSTAKDTPRWDSLRARIHDQLNIDDKCIADIARDLGRDYIQVYKCLSGPVIPSGEHMLSFVAWLFKASGKPSYVNIIEKTLSP